MANWYGTIECAGRKEEQNHTQERQNDELVMPFNCGSECGHGKTSNFSLSIDRSFTWSNRAVSLSMSNGQPPFSSSLNFGL